MSERKFTASAAIALLLPLAACTDGAPDPAQALADCEAQVADIRAEREAFVAENWGSEGEMPTELGEGAVSLDELGRFAELQTRLEEFENRIAVQLESCDALAGEQE